MTFLQEVGLLEVVAGDVVAFAAGSSVSKTQKIGSSNVTVSAQILPNGPTPDYQVFTGSFFSILGLALADLAAVQAGSPIKIAEKIGNHWYGESVTVSTT